LFGQIANLCFVVRNGNSAPRAQIIIYSDS
jgi:hypothetical protein